jgi:hypothetical protein
VLIPEDVAEVSGTGGGGDEDAERFTPGPDLIGSWTGTLETYERALPITLTIGSEEVQVSLDGSANQPLRDASLRDGFLRGDIDGTLGFEDAERRPYRIRLEFKIRDRVLNGSAIALSLPGNRVGNALTSWVEVRRRTN